MVHAVTSHIFGNLKAAGEWFATSNNLVLLEVEDEAALEDLIGKLVGAGVGVVPFREPDLDDALTAVAVGDDGRRLLSSLPLAFKLSE
jgi:hypothetical protein